jgi:hypothetical protein
MRVPHARSVTGDVCKHLRIGDSLTAMRKTIPIILGLAVMAGFSGSFAAKGRSGVKAQPSLVMLSRHPLTVRGLHFKKRERIRIVVETKSDYRRTQRASATGSFTAAFDEVTLGRCDTATVRATGNLGSRALLKLPKPLCIPA